MAGLDLEERVTYVRNQANLGIAEHGASFAEGQVGGDDQPSPGRRGRSAVRFRPLYPNKNLYV
jgi:hypothetical protein